MIGGINLKEYNCLGVTGNNIKVYLQNNKIVLIFPLDNEIDYDISFFIHIYENATDAYYKRDFNYKNISRDLPTKNIIVINSIKKIYKLCIGQWNGKKAIWQDQFFVREKILFCIDHYGGLFNMVSIKNKMHPNSVGFLIASVGNDSDNINFLKVIERLGVFDEVITVIPNSHNLMKIENETNLKNELITLFDTYLALADIDINTMEHIYTAFDTNALFTLYLELKNIQYTLVEMAINQFGYSWRENALINNNLVSKSYNDLLNQYSLYDGKSANCLSWYCYDETKKVRHMYDKPVQFIDYPNVLKNMSNEIVRDILLYYDIKIEDISSIDCLVLANSKYMFRELFKDKWECEQEYIAFYCMLIDYFADIDKSSKIVFKSHPLTQIGLEKYIPNIYLIPKEIPIEILNCIEKINIKKVLSVNTTSVEKITGCYIEDIQIGLSVASLYKAINLVWFIFSHFYSTEVISLGYENDALKKCFSFWNHHNEKKIINLDRIIVCNGVIQEIERLNDNDTIFIINENINEDLSRKYQYVIKINSKVFKTRSNSIALEEHKSMYIYSNKFIEKLEQKEEKELFFYGAKVMFEVEKL